MPRGDADLREKKKKNRKKSRCGRARGRSSSLREWGPERSVWAIPRRAKSFVVWCLGEFPPAFFVPGPGPGFPSRPDKKKPPNLLTT